MAPTQKPWIRRARDLHLYLGTFFAPAILFFAITGGLQTFSWHERTPGSNYNPPLWIQKLGQLHKKQTLILPVRKQPPPGESPDRRPAAGRPGTQPESEARPIGTILQKWFVFLMSLGLISTTLLGIYMAFKFNPGRSLIWILLLVGTLLPVTFALL